LGHFFRPSEHLAGGGKIEPALGNRLMDGGQHAVSPVDVGGQRRGVVFERIADETLCGQVVALVRLDLSHGLEHARETFDGGGIQGYLVEDVFDVSQHVLLVFQSHPGDDSVYFIPLREQEFRQIGTVLS